jgi:hypothetical protein
METFRSLNVPIFSWHFEMLVSVACTAALYRHSKENAHLPAFLLLHACREVMLLPVN